MLHSSSVASDAQEELRQAKHTVPCASASLGLHGR